MGQWEQERGEFILPSAEVSKVKKALRDAHNGHVDAVYDHCKRFWTNHRTQSDKKYAAAVEMFDRNLRSPGNAWNRNGEADHIADDVYTVLTRIGRAEGNNRGATRADLEAAGLSRATNRDNSFGTGHDFHISIDPERRTLRYQTDKNRRSIERSRSTPVVQAMFKALKSADWTRGTGGTIRSASEYGVDSAMAYGGQASHIANWFGPRGAEEYHHDTGFWPEGSPQRKAEQDKAAKRERAKRQREQKKAVKRREVARAAASGASFCGAPKKSGDGVCGRQLNGGRCPDHGVSKNALVMAGAAASTANTAGYSSADPLG